LLVEQTSTKPTRQHELLWPQTKSLLLVLPPTKLLVKQLAADQEAHEVAGQAVVDQGDDSRQHRSSPKQLVVSQQPATWMTAATKVLQLQVESLHGLQLHEFVSLLCM